MYFPLYVGCLLGISPYAASLVHRAPAGIEVTDHVLPLVVAPYPHPVTPSSKHLHRHRRRHARRQIFPLTGLVHPIIVPPGPPPPTLIPLGNIAPGFIPHGPLGPIIIPPGPPAPAVISLGPVAPVISSPEPVAPAILPPIPGVIAPSIVTPPVVSIQPIEAHGTPIVNGVSPANSSPPLNAPAATVEQPGNVSNGLSPPVPESLPSAGSEATIEQPIDTLGGRVYMTNITLAGKPYTVIIDTGSSDTWIASSVFQCTSRVSHTRLPQRSCGFGDLYDAIDSTTYEPIPDHTFSVKYSDEEYLLGRMGTEELSVGGVDGGKGNLTVRQTIGVVYRGWWMGDGRSSGLMGLAYPTLASNYRDLNYTTVAGSLFETHQIPPIFSLALSRPTAETPTAGGLLAIGGIPDIPYTTPFVSVPITPIASHTYAFYSIPIDGFSISPPSTPNSVPYPNTTATQNPSYAHQPQTMILDSGSTLLYLPDAMADYIASLFEPPARYIPASNTYVTSCRARMPRFGVIIAGETFFVNGEDMVNQEGRGRCTLAVQRQEDGDGVLGDAFLKNVLAVFDVGGHVVRLAGREVY